VHSQDILNSNVIQTLVKKVGIPPEHSTPEFGNLMHHKGIVVVEIIKYKTFCLQKKKQG
jgi:hypothetical protein